MNKRNPYFLLVLATILWGGNFVIGRAITDSMPPFTLSLLRWCTALIIFLPFAWPHFKKEHAQLKKNWHILILMSITGIAGFNSLLYLALHYTTSINASLVNTSTPIVIYILSFFILREQLNRNQMIGTVLSLAGLFFILSKGSLAVLVNFSFNFGDFIVLAAVVCWSIYSILIKRYTGILPGYSTFLVCIAVGILVLLPFAFYEIFILNIPIVWSNSSVFTILYTGVFASIVAFISWNTAVVRVGANKAGIFLNLIPVFAVIFAVLFIGEKIMWYQLAGGLSVIAGVYLSARSIPLEKKEKKMFLRDKEFYR
ncbi:DMT family transporter [Bacillus sp. V2I10]|uniref:DMT family transporter n=1 Tax=Bacillus sp. V2I10 TaxID=3042276 RepID=UPI002784B877|nr:DMT family transporter [Bacillus sp. V2I10]MDQ0861099.1 drug/metabolite transporter (DMT)-like permease [Bacillus sp. V2I10]